MLICKMAYGAKATNTALLLKNNSITPNRTLSPFQQFFGKRKRIILSLIQKFDEMCSTTYKENIHRAKLANGGTPGIWVSYADGHPTSSYQVLSNNTKKIMLTQDMTFLKKSYRDYSKVEKPVLVTISYEG